MTTFKILRRTKRPQYAHVWSSCFVYVLGIRWCFFSHDDWNRRLLKICYWMFIFLYLFLITYVCVYARAFYVNYNFYFHTTAKYIKIQEDAYIIFKQATVHPRENVASKFCKTFQITIRSHWTWFWPNFYTGETCRTNKYPPGCIDVSPAVLVVTSVDSCAAQNLTFHVTMVDSEKLIVLVNERKPMWDMWNVSLRNRVRYSL